MLMTHETNLPTSQKARKKKDSPLAHEGIQKDTNQRRPTPFGILIKHMGPVSLPPKYLRLHESPPTG